MDDGVVNRISVIPISSAADERGSRTTRSTVIRAITGVTAASLAAAALLVVSFSESAERDLVAVGSAFEPESVRLTYPVMRGDDRFAFKYVFGATGLMQNISSDPVTLERAFVRGVHGEMSHTGTAVFDRQTKGWFGAECGPLPVPKWPSQPVEGFKVPPDRFISILFEIQNSRRLAETAFTSVRVEYLVGGTRYYQTFRAEGAFKGELAGNGTCARSRAG